MKNKYESSSVSRNKSPAIEKSGLSHIFQNKLFNGAPSSLTRKNIELSQNSPLVS